MLKVNAKNTSGIMGIMDLNFVQMTAGLEQRKKYFQQNFPLI